VAVATATAHHSQVKPQFSWIFLISLTFPWPMSNSLTFPGFQVGGQPENSPHCSRRRQSVQVGNTGFPLFYWQKNPGLFQDFPGHPWKISQDLFGAHECLNIKKKRSPRPEGPRAGWGSWGESRAASLPPARGLGECCKLPQRGPGQSPRKFEIWCNLRCQNSL